jgi:hypothetical protein
LVRRQMLEKKTANSKPIPHNRLPFEEAMKSTPKVSPTEKWQRRLGVHMNAQKSNVALQVSEMVQSWPRRIEHSELALRITNA